MNRIWEKEFADRFSRYEEELKRLYAALYHRDTQAYASFVTMLYKAWEQRHAALKKLDRAREAKPDWPQSQALTGMRLDVPSFAGTLQGAAEKIDYLTECGVGVLRLGNVLAGRQTASGETAVTDFRAVQPELGTMKDLADLAAACRKAKILLCAEVPLDATASDHPWAKSAAAGEVADQRRYFCFADWDIPNAYEQGLGLSEGETGFTWCAEAQRLVMTTRDPELWDLNYANPDVLRDMAENLLYLSNQGVDVLHLRGLDRLWKAMGTPCRNLPQTHTLARLLRIVCGIVCPGTLLMADLAGEGQAAYDGTEARPECHLQANPSLESTLWHTVAARDTRLLAHELTREFALPRETVCLHSLRSPDGIRWTLNFDYLAELGVRRIPHIRFLNEYLTGYWVGSPSRGVLSAPEQEDARVLGTSASLCGIQMARECGDPGLLIRGTHLVESLYALLYTLRGIPELCAGDEVGQESVKGEPPVMDWEKAERRRETTTPEGQIFQSIRKMERVRGSHHAFRPEADLWLLNPVNDRVLGIGRFCGGEQLLALFNFSDADEVAWLHDLEIYTDLMTGETQDAGAVRLPKGSFRWLARTV